MFERWGDLAHRFRVPMLVVVVLAVVSGGVWGLGVFDRMSQGGYEAPGSEAVRAKNIAQDVLDESGGDSGGDVVVVYEAPPQRTVDDPQLAQDIGRTLDALPDSAATEVMSYWSGPVPIPQLATEDRTAGLATITLAGEGTAEKMESYEKIKDALDAPGVPAKPAGLVPMQASMQDHATSDLTKAEAVSMPIVLVLLVVIFGGVVAASLPVLVGGLAVFGSLGLLRLISMFSDVNVFAVNVASLLGLGLAIDYGLFLVGRFREERAAGVRTPDAVRRSVASAGRTVAFSATLLVIALAGLLLFPQDFLKSLAYGGMSAVALAAVLSLTVLPALLGILGHRVDALALPWRRQDRAPSDRGWKRWANGVMRRPVLTAVPIIAVLGLLGTGFLGVQFGTPDERALPSDDRSRQAIETLRDDFPAMSEDGMEIVVRGDVDQPSMQHYADSLVALPGIDTVEPAAAHENTTVLTASLTADDPFGAEANDTVRDVRALDAPVGAHEVLVGGQTALNLDSLQATMDMLPYVVGLLVAATLLLMFLAFGSVLLPVKAVVMSALSLCATFGVLTWVFVDGYGAGLLGVTPAPLEVGIVVLMASLVFGLSTDYEVFLLSRMVEARAQGASTEDAVRTGLARTGRMITAAALLLIVVTGAFAFSGITIMRFVGVGMILALALDATLVRMVLVPAVLKLMGNAAWWAPRPFQRVQQRVGAEESGAPAGERELERV